MCPHLVASPSLSEVELYWVLVTLKDRKEGTISSLASSSLYLWDLFPKGLTDF